MVKTPYDGIGFVGTVSYLSTTVPQAENNAICQGVLVALSGHYSMLVLSLICHPSVLTVFTELQGPNFDHKLILSLYQIHNLHTCVYIRKYSFHFILEALMFFTKTKQKLSSVRCKVFFSKLCTTEKE